MRGRERPRRREREIVVQHIGAETLLYDEQSHRAYCLNASAAAVWRAADGERTMEGISAAASAELGVELSEELVRLALAQLRSEGLMEALDENVAPAAISRRAALGRLGVAGAMLLPAVSAIVAPTAAQAYSGCVDCSNSAAQAARARRQQQLNQAAPRK